MLLNQNNLVVVLVQKIKNVLKLRYLMPHNYCSISARSFAEIARENVIGLCRELDNAINVCNH